MKVLLKLRDYYRRVTTNIHRMLFGRKFKNFGNAQIKSPFKIVGAEFIEIGNAVFINSGAWLEAKKIDEHDPSLVIGDRARINRFLTLSAIRSVRIKDNVNMGERVYICDNSHGFEDVNTPIRDQPIQFKRDVSIGPDTWIGTNVCILGANVGKHCVIGANSVVTKDIPDFCVAAGVPAKIIKKYNFEVGEWQSVVESTRHAESLAPRP